MNRKFGALKSPESPDDCIFERLAHAGSIITQIPSTYDLREHSLPPRDQGAKSTCGAFTASSITEIRRSLMQGDAEYISPEFIYYHRQNKPSHGMYGRNVMQILQHIGSVPEELFPYDHDGEPTDELYDIAHEYKIPNYARITTVGGLKRALYENGPCYLTLPVFNTGDTFWKSDNPNDMHEHLGHAVTVVGYTEDGFIIRNSWGLDWGEEGHNIFPYSDWPKVWECWIPVGSWDEEEDEEDDYVSRCNIV